MKMLFKITLFFVLFGLNANAQFFKKLEQKVKETAERTIERKVDEKAERTTEKVLDTILEKPERVLKSKKSTTKSDVDNEPIMSMDDFMNSSGNVAYEPKYIFNVTATIETEDANSALKKMTMKQGYGKNALLTEMEIDGDPIIIDMKNLTAIMLSINDGTAQVMSLQWMEKMMGNSGTESAPSSDVKSTVQKTGKTKNMNGYMCHEYNITFEGGKINTWYAPDVTFEYQDYLRGMAKMFSSKKEENPTQLLNTEYGYVMEMTFFTPQGIKQNSMKVIALSEKVRMITMDNFKIQKL